MIRVVQATEPSTFDSVVRQPGQTFLASTPTPHSKQWEGHDYWTRSLSDLHHAYSGICCYSCHWIPLDTGSSTVDHFKPKHRHPGDAYDWKNFRLACGRMNARKSVFEDVLDPFLVENGWFILTIHSMIIRPHPGLDAVMTEKVISTIERLKLNDPLTVLSERRRWLTSYCTSQVSFEHLKQNAPFIALEIERQGKQETIKDEFLAAQATI